MKKWDVHHSKWVNTWNAMLQVANEPKRYLRDHKPFDRDAFNSYLAWFVPQTRVSLCPTAFEELIFDMENNSGDEAMLLRYNNAVKEGNQTEFAPIMNFMVIIYNFILCHHN